MRCSHFLYALKIKYLDMLTVTSLKTFESKLIQQSQVIAYKYNDQKFRKLTGKVNNSREKSEIVSSSLAADM